jgi:hypothetical protein
MQFLKKADQCRCGAKLPKGATVGWDEKLGLVFNCAACRPCRPASPDLLKDRNYYRQLPVKRLIALGMEVPPEGDGELALVLAETLEEMLEDFDE